MLITERMCFYPDPIVYCTPKNWGLEYEEFTVKTPDEETLVCWHIHPPRDVESKKACILHLHGNAQNMTSHVAGAVFLVQEGYRLVTFDYRGYGDSTGRTNLKTLIIDAEAILERLLEEPFKENEKLFAFGQS